MASLGQSFSQEDLPQQSGDYSPIPDGWYTAVIHSATIKDTNMPALKTSHVLTSHSSGTLNSVP